MKKIRKYISVILAVLMVTTAVPMNVFADDIKTDISGSDENVSWSYTAATDTLYINGEEILIEDDGALPTYKDGEYVSVDFSHLVIGKDVTTLEYAENCFSANVPSSYVYEQPFDITFEDGIQLKTIGQDAFECSTVVSVVFPDSVEIIDEFSFNECYNLESIVLPKNLKQIDRYAFYGCPISVLKLPESLKYIDDYAFYQADITELNLTENLTSIGSYAFANCSSIEQINFNENTAKLYIGSGAFRNTAITEITIPSYVNILYSSVFSSCVNLATVNFEVKETENGLQGLTQLYNAFSGTPIKSITLPETLTYLKGPISGMSELQSVDMSKTKVTKLYDKMFSGDSNLTDIKFPSGLTELGSYTFSGCTSLISMVLPDTVTTLSTDGYQFNGCTSLEYVKLPDSLEVLPTYMFYKCTNLDTVVIPSALKEISNSVFSMCKSLTNISVPDTVTKIGANAFNSCPADFDLPSNLTSVGGYAFTNSGLTKAVFSSNVNINSYGFYNSDNLTQVVLPKTYGNTTLNNYAFYGCDNLKSAYISANITALGTASFQECKSLTDVVFAEGSKLNTINRYAFKSCTGLEKIFLPSTVSVIDDESFKGCSSLKTINLEDTQIKAVYNYAFAYTGLEHITFPDTLTGFRYNAFKGSKLTSLELSEKISGFDKDRFEGCPITKVTVYNPNFNFSDNTFSGAGTTIRGYKGSTAETFAADNGMTFIPLDAGELETSDIPTYGSFDGGTWVVTVDKELVISGNGAINSSSAYDNSGWKYSFAQLVELNGVNSVIISDGITALPDNFLYDSKFSTESLKTVSLPQTLISIGSNAFKYTNLSYIDLPDSVTSIGDYAFYDAGLKNGVKLSNSLAAINQYAFANNDFSSVTIPDSVISIGLAAFNNCKNLSTMYIPHTVTVIDEGASTTKPVGFTSSGDRLEDFTVECSLDSRAYQYAYRNGISIRLDMEGDCISGYYSTRSCAKWYYYPDNKEFYFVTNGVQPSNHTFYYSDGTAVGEGELDISNLTVCYGVTELSGIGGASAFSVLNPETITLPETLITIGDNAFSGLTNLKSVTLPDSLTSLSAAAFENCSVEAVSFGNGIKVLPDYLFKDNKTLRFVDFGSVQTIGKGAFQSCTALEEINIPYNLSVINESAFAKCLSVKAVTIENGKALSIYEKAFADLPLCDTVKVERDKINYYYTDEKGNSTKDVFFYNTDAVFRNLGTSTTGVSLTFGNTVTDSADLAMFNNKNIVELNIGANISSISNYEKLPALNAINIDEGNETYFSYDGCLYSRSSNNIISLIIAPPNLKEVEIYEGTRWIEPYAFCESKIEHIEIPEGVTEIEEGAFKDCTELRKITFPTTLQTISYYAFQNCTKLKIVDIPSAIYINDSAFENCTNLSSILLPANLENIDLFAFAGCTSLIGIVMPNNDAYLSFAVFENCTSLTDVYMWNNDFQADTFIGCDNVVIHTFVGSDSYALAKEYGFECVVYTDEDIFADECAMMENIYEGYLGFCSDGHGDIQYLTVYEPTCEQDGYIIGVCEYCSVILEEIHIDACGHNYENTVSIDATATTGGVEKYTCSNCGESYCNYTPAFDSETSEKTFCSITGTTVIANSKAADSGVTPLKSVSVKLGDETLAVTDSNGEFSFSIETGVYELTLCYNYGFERTVFLVAEDRDVDIGAVALIACDWNKDGKIDDGDFELFKFVISSERGDAAYLDYVDMNNDGRIDVKDLVYMNYVKGIDSSGFTYPTVIACAN